MLAWASFPAARFAYRKGSPRVFESSERGRREFCEHCGTQILFRELGAPSVDVNMGSLDHPEALTPDYHIFTASRIPWFDTADDLPRYERDEPGREAP